ncbi:MAG: methyltransferase [Pseudonocardiaceae bacterium]|nr:methyltransferase [Pseudonocardiaceae bacterium]
MTNDTNLAAAEQNCAAAWHTLAPVMDLITPMALRVAATLRLADLIDDGVTGMAELAQRSGSDPDALGRMLRQLVVRGVFTEPEPDVFAVNELSALLRSDHPSGMRTWLDLDGFGGQMDLAFTGLLHTVRTGKPAWERVFGAPFWQHLDADPALHASFDATMSASPEYLTDAAGGYDWSDFRHVLDIGGGDASLLAEVLRARPWLRGTLVDLPDTVERGRQRLASEGLAERCELVGQSFFEPLPAGGDVYVLRGVVHDWDDDEAVAILRRCAEAAGESGRVLIVEAHGTSGDDPASFAEMNLRMLVLSGGRERTLDDYRELVARAGLRVTSTHVTPLDNVLIDCRPG